jgi:hypothetical protein
MCVSPATTSFNVLSNGVLIILLKACCCDGEAMRPHLANLEIQESGISSCNDCVLFELDTVHVGLTAQLKLLGVHVP